MQLVIANKLYSSWSMRPWLLMRAFDISFEETVIPLRLADTKTEILKYSPSGKVPVLIDGDVVVWDSLAIISYLDWKFPDKGIFPKGAAERAHALAICHELHSGFQALRGACPMNLGKRFVAKAWSADVLADVARLDLLIRDTWKRFDVAHGRCLFETFGAADAMIAPYMCRLAGYQFDVGAATSSYMDLILTDPSYRAWRRDAFNEIWVISEYEDGHVVEENLIGG